MRAFRNLGDAELMPLSDIDGGWLAGQIEDWIILVRLHQLGFDGLVTGDDSMIELPKELAVLTQLKMLLLVLARSNRNMVETTGLLLVHIRRVLEQRDPSRAQLFVLHPPAGERPEDDLTARFKARARHYKKKNADAYLTELRVPDEQLERPVQEWYATAVAERQLTPTRRTAPEATSDRDSVVRLRAPLPNLSLVPHSQAALSVQPSGRVLASPVVKMTREFQALREWERERKRHIG